MLESNQISAHQDPSAVFLGVRFFLIGFDAIRKEEIRLKLIECGGVDAVDYGSGCTHVICDKIVYDDPICVAARRDGKIVVSALWVEHSFDVADVAPTTLIIYRPMRDLNGIPGAKSMVACLTGYQRPDREDIMTMVGLMGASFSKPLVAHKVTHLICYKFEGEKYELAKKMKSIKLVNHYWLEDCLKAWELLPETEYSKSTYEVDMEVQAKDSEDETEDKAIMREAGSNTAINPQTAQYESKLLDQSPMKQGISRNSLHSSASKSLADVGRSSHKVQSTPRNNPNVEKASLTRDSFMHLETSVRSSPKVSSGVPSCSHGGAVIHEMAEISKKSPTTDVSKIHDKSHSRSPLKPSVSVNSERTEGVTCRRRSTSMMEIYGVSGGSMVPLEQQQDGADFYEMAKTPLKQSDLQFDKAQNASLPAKTKPSPSHSISRSQSVSTGLKFPLEKHQVGADSNEVVKTPLKKTDLQLDEVDAASLSDKRKMNLLQSNSKLKRMSPVLPLPLETHQDEPVLHEVAKTPLKETDLQVDEAQTTSLPAKRKINLSDGNSSSRRVSPGFRSSVDIKSAAKTTDILASEFSFDGSPELAGHILPTTENSRLTDVASKDGQQRSQLVLKSYQRGSKKQTSSDNLEMKDQSLNQTDSGSHEVELGQSTEPPFLKTNVASIEKSDQSADLSLSKSGTTGPSLKRVSLSKKRLGSKPGIDNGRIVNTKGSIGLKKAIKENDYVAHPDASIITAATNCVTTATGVMMGNTDRIKASTSKVHESHREAINEDGLQNDETEAPDDETENQFVESIDVEFEAPDKCGADKAVAVDAIGEQSEGNIEAAKVQMVNSEEEKNDSGDNAVPGKNIVLAESKSMIDAKKKTSPKGKKRPAKTKKTVSERDEDSETEEGSTKVDENKAVDHNDETVRLVGKAKGRPSKKLKNSIDGEKENKRVTASPQSLSNDTGAAEKVLSNFPKDTTNESLKSNLGVCGSIRKVHDHETKSEPACFILSGHKLQRKEFQQVIKRLRGKVCRDSHNWSYQATHFIVPDPVRRTEKFFAAAASGSWILKMDYLTSSNEAGKFLFEEPYEWHKKGLSEDGAINLEAPRKWRLVRERTGHCAFHGMRIVIYGECIAPPLDTLKRVIKAGEGTILATSPPYSRFFQSGIDFAVVCPGMPRVDMWVQEFLRHEVPCVSADYLVEYVCKPGYSLERHVQYNTHAWAEKSLKNLVGRVEEVDDVPRTPEDQGTDDVACLVCDSRDRGDEMLICGDESGNRGCGAGMHLDCSDPPLQHIPEENWFCPSCSKKEGTKSAGQSNSKRSKSTFSKKRSRSKK